MRRRYIVRQAERVALGTPYPEVVGRVKSIVAQMSVLGQCVVVLDGTGVGVAVLDLMREIGVGCRVLPVVITSGQASSSTHVPRVELVTKMQVMAQRGELEIAAGCGYLDQLKRELVHLRLEGRRSGGGEHDDMALALALACWRAKVR